METELAQTNKLNRPAYTTFPLSTTINQLELLHMDLVGTMDNINIERKMVIYMEAIWTTSVHLEQSYLRPKSYSNPHVIGNMNSI